MIPPALVEEIRKYACEKYPEEMCGFIVEDKFIPVQNRHEDPNDHFRVSKEDWRDNALKCTAFIHSHPDWYACPSESDMRSQIASKIPWGIISTDGQACTPITWFGAEVPIPDLLNRTFCHGVTDCYSLIRDWYQVERGITLNEYVRDWEWWETEDDLYTSNFQDAGFKEVHKDEIMSEGPKVGDVFLANIGPGVLKLNHAGVYVGDGLGLHHVTSREPVDPSRLARREPINRWMNHIHMWIRYEETDIPVR